MTKIYKFNEDKKGFGSNLKNLMADKGYTVESFSNEIGYGENTIKKWRAGKRIPNLETLKIIANLFNITVHELYLPNSIYKYNISEDFTKVLDGRVCINTSNNALIEELKLYSNYLFQKMLFSYLNPRDCKEMIYIYKYFSLTEYSIAKLSIKDTNDFDEFYTKIKKYLIEQYGYELPYKIDNELSEQILNEFNKFIFLNIKEVE